MIEIVVPEQHYEPFDERTLEFLPPVNIKETKIQLEHSLISLKKWEQKTHRPFLKELESLSQEDFIEYIRCMSISNNVDPEVYKWIPKESLDAIMDYIRDPMTATWFNDNGVQSAQASFRRVITAEIIYYWMIALNIPVEFQKWHLNQLLTLIKVVSIKNKPPEKKDPKVAARQRAALNAKRRAECKSNG